ncbi:hypothetical protein MTR67_012532 [Solanum verrucosum]|uniref:Retrotransposon gag domain-containing protein n=1 Tax=Solanum verrucosum TaxID=315347 RepID=A0AAF0TG21_SOLVR|nr:hypothetical protein MTR67_012532 [Solanum verrucosum]
MTVTDYSHRFNSFARYAPHIVRTIRSRVHHYVDGFLDHLIRDCKVASLSDDVDISCIQTFAQTTEDLSKRICDTRKDREQMGSVPSLVQGPQFNLYSQLGPGHSSGQPEGHR